MSVTPKVSVLIPTYNYGHYMEETLRSVFDQTFTDYELVVVDNCSTDNTAELMQPYLSDPRVRYHRHESNIGVVGNFNACLDLAKGEYIKFLCADDRFAPKMLETYVKIMDEMPGVSLITCDKQAFGSKTHETITPVTHLQPGSKAVLSQLRNNYCWIGEPSSVMFRKKDQAAAGYFSYEYSQYVDWEYWIKLLSLGDCYIVPEKLAYVRFHPGTVSRQMKKRRFVLCFEEYKLCKDVQQGRYGIDTRGSDIDLAVKERAAACIKKAMLKTIPELYSKDARAAFAKAFRIAKEEKMFTETFSELYQGLKRKTIRRFAS